MIFFENNFWNQIILLTFAEHYRSNGNNFFSSFVFLAFLIEGFFYFADYQYVTRQISRNLFCV